MPKTLAQILNAAEAAHDATPSHVAAKNAGLNGYQRAMLDPTQKPDGPEYIDRHANGAVHGAAFILAVKRAGVERDLERLTKRALKQMMPHGSEIDNVGWAGVGWSLGAMLAMVCKQNGRYGPDEMAALLIGGFLGGVGSQLLHADGPPPTSN